MIPPEGISPGAEASQAPSLLAPSPAHCWAPVFFCFLLSGRAGGEGLLAHLFPHGSPWWRVCGGSSGPNNIQWPKYQGTDNKEKGT